MTGRLGLWTWVGAMTLVLGALVGLGCAVLRPNLPMTVARADRLFGAALRPGQSRHDVTAWLASQSIDYDVLERSEDETHKGWWMDVVGHQTVAECAGLDLDSIDAVIRVSYPERQYLFDRIQIRVYLFFDSRRRLLRHWVEQFSFGL